MEEMKKDRLIEEKFDGYRDGVYAAPYSNAKAKAYVEEKKKKTRTFRMVLASVGSVVAVCAAVILCLNFFAFPKGDGIEGDYEGSMTENVLPEVYYGSALTAKTLNAYNSAPEGMEFVNKLSKAKNSEITEFVGYEEEGTPVLVKAQISSFVNGKRADAVIYAEYSSGVYEELKDFRNALGDKGTYKGCDYEYGRDFDCGEYVSNTYFENDGVKYYLIVRSSDGAAMGRYINLILD